MSLKEIERINARAREIDTLPVGYGLTEVGKAAIAPNRVVAALEKFRIAQKAARDANLAFGQATDQLQQELKDWGVVATIEGLDQTRMVQE